MGSNPEPSPSLLHALVFPLPLQGHINPMMHLTEQLASAGLTVTFVTTHHTHSQITKAHFSKSRNNPIHLGACNLGLDIRSARISDGLPFNFDRSGMFLDHMRAVENMGEELEQLIHSLNKAGPPISCVIADTILYWSLDVTKKFGIPWISFWTQSTTVYSIYHHAHLLEAHNYEGACTGKNLIDYIPGVPTLHPTDLPCVFREKDFDSEYALHIVLKSLESSRRADWIFSNTFDHLESAEINLEPPVLQVGPLLPLGCFKDENPDYDRRIATSIWTEYECSAWLETKPKDSVIYVSFGSMIHLSKAELEEIAMGLNESGQPFLWVLRPDIVASSDCAALTDGFLHEMGIGLQGLVVPWCNQLQVLAHRSVGGFLTHCGWNSMLESIALGVPMLGFPVWSEQYTNCVLMADVWKIGLSLRGGSQAGDSNNLIVREDISKAVRKLFTAEGKEMKKNVKALSDSASTAILEGGSSHKNIENFVKGLKARTSTCSNSK